MQIFWNAFLSYLFSKRENYGLVKRQNLNDSIEREEKANDYIFLTCFEDTPGIFLHYMQVIH